MSNQPTPKSFKFSSETKKRFYIFSSVFIAILLLVVIVRQINKTYVSDFDSLKSTIEDLSLQITSLDEKIAKGKDNKAYTSDFNSLKSTIKNLSLQVTKLDKKVVAEHDNFKVLDDKFSNLADRLTKGNSLNDGGKSTPPTKKVNKVKKPEAVFSIKIENEYSKKINDYKDGIFKVGLFTPAAFTDKGEREILVKELYDLTFFEIPNNDIKFVYQKAKSLYERSINESELGIKLNWRDDNNFALKIKKIRDSNI